MTILPIVLILIYIHPLSMGGIDVAVQSEITAAQCAVDGAAYLDGRLSHPIYKDRPVMWTCDKLVAQ